MLVKPRCGRCFQFSAVGLQFFKKSTTSQTHFGFTYIESKYTDSVLKPFTFDNFNRNSLYVCYCWIKVFSQLLIEIWKSIWKIRISLIQSKKILDLDKKNLRKIVPQIVRSAWWLIGNCQSARITNFEYAINHLKNDFMKLTITSYRISTSAKLSYSKLEY